MKRYKQKAWLLTWEWIGEHAAVEDRIAGILRPRLSREKVSEIVEYLYAFHTYSLSELAYYARRPKDNPYKAQWEHNHCFCGHNPYLHANYVHELVVFEDPNSGLETIEWVYPALYKRDPQTLERRLVRGALKQSITRTITGPLSDRKIGRYNR